MSDKVGSCEKFEAENQVNGIKFKKSKKVEVEEVAVERN